VLVDSNGTTRIAGFGSASIFSTLPSPGDEVSINQSALNCAPEPTSAQVAEVALGSPLLAKASDVYYFGIMAWKVWMDSFVHRCSVHSLEIDSRWTTPVLWNGRDCGNPLGARS
jgi:hypothetical protein